MLFHITHVHDEKTCPGNNEEVFSKTFGIVLDTLEEHLNEVIGAWMDPVGHTSFFVVDADESSQIFSGLFPIVDAGTAKIQPVGDYAAMLKMRKELNS